MFKKESRYVTKGVNETLDLRLQLILWNMVDKLDEEGKELDYLQVFRIRNCEEKTIIEHTQEVPEYKEIYTITLKDVEIEENVKIFVVDDCMYSTMML